jgi:hypothetical protein
MTIFGGPNKADEVHAVAARHNASMVILLRRNHVAHAISAYRHFTKVPHWTSRKDLMVPWNWQTMQDEATQRKTSYDKLLSFIPAAPRVHLIFYEDLKAHPSHVWDGLQEYLGLPRLPLPNIAELEAKSTSRPSAEYLTDLSELRRMSLGTEWHAMLLDTAYDDRLDFHAEFQNVCSRSLGTAVSWRAGNC